MPLIKYGALIDIGGCACNLEPLWLVTYYCNTNSRYMSFLIGSKCEPQMSKILEQYAVTTIIQKLYRTTTVQLESIGLAYKQIRVVTAFHRRGCWL